MRKTRKMLAVLVAVVMVMGLVPGGAGADGAVLEVGADKPYTTIQAAIAEADPGDTILVDPGTYVEIVTVNKALTLQSTEMHAAEIVGSVTVQSSVASVTVDGFKFQAYAGWPNPYGLGTPYNTALVSNASVAVVVNNVFLGAEIIQGPYTYSSLVNITGDSITLHNNTIQQVINVASEPNAAYVVVNGGGTAEITGNTCTAALGIGLGEGAGVAVTNNTVLDAPKEGIWFWPVASTATMVVQDNAVLDNDAASVGAKALKLVSKPASVNGETLTFDMLAALEANNPAVDTFELSWMTAIHNSTQDTFHATIQAAITAAAPGDTILVAAGTYAENVTVSVADLTLQSAVLHGAEIQGTVVIQAEGVVVDGFKITNFSRIPTPDWSGIYISSGTGVQVVNNLIDGAAIDPVANLTVGVHTLYGGVAEVSVQGNTISNVRMGVYNQGAAMAITGNTITNATHCAIGIDTGLVTTICDNLIKDCSLGIEVFQENVMVTGNTFENNDVQVDDVNKNLGLDNLLADNTFDRAVVVEGGNVVFGGIQAAIDAADPNDTIQVAAGTYAENVFIPNDKDGLTLLGTNAGIPAGVSPGVRGPETIIAGTINIGSGTAGVGSITVDGFTINSNGSHGVYVRGRDTITISNNIMDGGSHSPPNTQGIGKAAVGNPKFVITHNTITNYRQGAYIDGTETQASLIEGNHISNVVVGVALTKSLTVGFEFTNNVIGNASLEALSINNDNNVVQGNTFADSAAGVRLYGDTGPNNDVRFNRIVGNSVGVENLSVNSVDATLNWWGHDSGPHHATGNPDGTGDAVSDNVAFTPWFVTPLVDIESPVSGRATSRISLTVEGTYVANYDAIGGEILPALTVTVNVTSVTPTYGGGSFSAVVPLEMGWQDITVATRLEEGAVELSDSATISVSRLSPVAPPAEPPPPPPHVAEVPAAPPAAPPPPPPYVGKEVSPDTGGSVALPDETIVLEVPTGATETPVTFSVGELPSGEVPEVPGTFTVAGKAVKVTAEDADGQPVRDFTAPLTITFQFTGEDVGSDWEDLVIMYYDEDLGWVELPTIVDPVTGLVSATFDHLTVFAVVRATPPVVEYGTQKVVMLIGDTRYTAAHKLHNLDVAPFIQSDRTFVPVRFLAEAFGAEADWEPKDASLGVVTLTRADMTVTIEIGSKLIEMERDGVVTSVESDVAAFIKDGRTMLPFRVIAEAFGAEVDYGPKDAPIKWVRFEQ